MAGTWGVGRYATHAGVPNANWADTIYGVPTTLSASIPSLTQEHKSQIPPHANPTHPSPTAAPTTSVS
ncbi:MAG: hypothetical protein RSE58_12220, partial [Clostridia bacterium]